MDAWIWVALGTVVLGGLILLGGAAARARHYKLHYGAEYERLSARKGATGALRELSEREPADDVGGTHVRLDERVMPRR